MLLNADFSKPVLVHSASQPWQKSPIPGVDRRPLDRVGGELARATSIVRYAAGSVFSPHVHAGGEEFLVIEGVFQDEYGEYPAGSYVRNPPQSKHQPGSALGCILLVKLWQFDLNDQLSVRINSNNSEYEVDHLQATIRKVLLHKDSRETVSIQYWQADSSVTIAALEGLELLVLEGDVQFEGEVLQQHSWLRLPVGSNFVADTGKNGAKIWLKQGHLRYVEEQLAALPNAGKP